MQRITFSLVLLVIGSQVAYAEDRFTAVKHYWEWSAYWGFEGLDFPLAQYRAMTSFKALTFSADYGGLYWGFCSKSLGVCQVLEYFAPAGALAFHTHNPGRGPGLDSAAAPRL